MIPFEIWIVRLKRLMIYYEYIKSDTVIAAEEFRPLYEQGMKPIEALDADMGFKHPQPMWSKVVLGLTKGPFIEDVKSLEQRFREAIEDEETLNTFYKIYAPNKKQDEK